MKAPIQQLDLFPSEADKLDTTSTFTGNLSLPIHRWFRYSAGFSALWVRSLIEQEALNGRRNILDPFAGSGTVLLESERCGIEAIGIDAHPFVARIAKTKLLWRVQPILFQEYCLSILARAKVQQGTISSYPSLIVRCFPAEILERLDALRQSWLSIADGSALSELAWLALASIIRECSPVGTAQWQYVLPNKSKAKPIEPYQAFTTKFQFMVKDMTKRQQMLPGPHANLLQEDARLCINVPDDWADLIITSPPYANNYDYADATRLEMTFFGEIQGWGDLQNSVRSLLVPSCTQHVAKQVGRTQEIINEPLLAPIRPALVQVCDQLEIERDSHGGKKPYHTMIASYFLSMAQVWISLRRVTRDGADVCFVIGDSAPYGVYVPVDEWLGQLALAAGFKDYRFEKTRDRNTKWKNRKHRVPLHEGRLWVRG